MLCEVLVAFENLVQVLAPFWIEGSESKRAIIFVQVKAGMCVFDVVHGK